MLLSRKSEVCTAERSRSVGGRSINSHYRVTHLRGPYRVLHDGIPEQFDLLKIMKEDVHEGVQLEKRGAVDIAPATHIDARDNLVT